jgi:zinc protease
MRNRFGWLLFILALPASATPLQKLGVELRFHREVLPNGLTVILAPAPQVPVISYQTWYRVGSVDEKIGKTGLAHLFEHLMFKGTEKFGPKEFFNRLESQGAEVNAYTTQDYTVYYQNFTPNLLDRVIEMEADRMVGLKLDQDLLTTERQVVLEERRLRVDNSPAGKLHEAMWGLSFREHPYRAPVIGYPQDLLKLTLEDLKSFYRDFYHPANATIVVAGAFDQTQTLEKIRARYGQIPQRVRPERKVSSEPAQDAERRISVFDQVSTEQFAWSYVIPRAGEPDAYALDVLSTILFQGTSSRAHRRMVEDKSLLIGISGTAYTPAFPGLFMISGTLRKGVELTKVEKELAMLLEEVQKTPPSAEEVERAVRQLTVSAVDHLRTPQGVAQLLGAVQTVLGDVSRSTEDLEKYRGITPSDLQRVAKKYLLSHQRSVVLLLPGQGGSLDEGGAQP